MSQVSTTVRIAAPPELVFDLIADPGRGPEWQTMIIEMGDIAGRPGGVGSSFVAFYRLAGRRIEGRFVVTAAERPTLHQASGSTRGGWARWTTLIEPVDAGSEVRVDIEYELPGEILSGLFGILTGNRLEHELRHTYENLRRVAESEARGQPRSRPEAATSKRERAGAPDDARPSTREADDTPDDPGEESEVDFRGTEATRDEPDRPAQPGDRASASLGRQPVADSVH